MRSTKVRSWVVGDARNELDVLAREARRSLSGVVTEAIRDDVEHERVCPEASTHLEPAAAEDEELGCLLAE